jgi:hypothetical protein
MPKDERRNGAETEVWRDTELRQALERGRWSAIDGIRHRAQRENDIRPELNVQSLQVRACSLAERGDVRQLEYRC